MTTKTKNQESPEKEDRLLSSKERAILSQIATDEPPHSWRAQALLAIDEGATQVEAGRQAGLTKGQVRYWLDKFRKDGTSIFPEELLNQAQQAVGEDEVQQEMPVAEETAGPVDEAAAQQEDAPKPKKKAKKKTKKASKSKKIKKPKQDKKKKKGKKPTKKTKKKGSKKAKDGRGKSSKKTKKKSKK